MEFKYKSEPREIIDKYKNIFEILRNFKNIMVDKIKVKNSMNTGVNFNKFERYAAKNMPMIKKIQIAASGLLFTIE
ncbi:MAG: hypothetical protein NTV71_02405 [Candidatus Omnitrophica bacterium]|nr:hypothetical protein [Candidatus Omnitrophota bacterium]